MRLHIFGLESNTNNASDPYLMNNFFPGEILLLGSSRWPQIQVSEYHRCIRIIRGCLVYIPPLLHPCIKKFHIANDIGRVYGSIPLQLPLPSFNFKQNASGQLVGGKLKYKKLRVICTVVEEWVTE